MLRGILNVTDYFDDIIITGCNMVDHIKTIELVLTKLNLVGLRFNSSKCAFFKGKVSYLGFNIDCNSLNINKHMIALVLGAAVLLKFLKSDMIN